MIFPPFGKINAPVAGSQDAHGFWEARASPGGLPAFGIYLLGWHRVGIAKVQQVGVDRGQVRDKDHMASAVVADNEHCFVPAARVVMDEFPVLKGPAASLVQGVQGIARLDNVDRGKVHEFAVLREDRAQVFVRHRVQRGNACDDMHVGSSKRKTPPITWTDGARCVVEVGLVSRGREASLAPAQLPFGRAFS